MATEARESDKEHVANCDANSVPYHIIDIGHPECNFGHKSRYELPKFDNNTKERANNHNLFYAKIRNKRQSEAKRYEKQNVQKCGFEVLESERDKRNKIHSFFSRLSLQHKAWHKVLQKKERLKLK